MVQWLSSNNYIFEPVFFSESSNLLVFILTVADPERVPGGGGDWNRLFHFYRDIQKN